MKILSVRQPWASLIAEGHKKIETRNWPVKYRGRIGIHASKTYPPDDQDLCGESPFFKSAIGRHRATELPTGVIICTVELYDIRSTTGYGNDFWTCNLSDKEREFGDYTSGRFGWFLRDVHVLKEPIPAKGALSLWEYDGDLP